LNFQFTHPLWLLLLLPALAWTVWLFLTSDVQINAWRRWAALTMRGQFGLRWEAQRHTAFSPATRYAFDLAKAPSPLRSAGAVQNARRQNRQSRWVVPLRPGSELHPLPKP